MQKCQNSMKSEKLQLQHLGKCFSKSGSGPPAAACKRPHVHHALRTSGPYCLEVSGAGQRRSLLWRGWAFIVWERRIRSKLQKSLPRCQISEGVRKCQKSPRGRCPWSHYSCFTTFTAWLTVSLHEGQATPVRGKEKWSFSTRISSIHICSGLVRKASKIPQKHVLIF